MSVKDPHDMGASDVGMDQTSDDTGIDDAGSSSKIDLFSVGVLNSLTAHIAVLDSDGKIIAINGAWKQFAVQNGGEDALIKPGANYFDACRQAVSTDGLQEATEALNGIRKVLSDELPEFELEYACHSPDEMRWFLMRVTPMRFIGSKAVVSHINITDKKLAEESLVNREQELSALSDISRAVSASISFPSVSETVLKKISETLNPDMAALFLKENDKLLLQGVGPHGGVDGFEVEHVHRVGHCLCGLAASSGDAIYSKSIHEDERCTWQECKRAGITSFAAIPLKSRQDVVGVLGIASVRQRDFSKRRHFLESMASDIAVCIDNSLLYEKARSYAEDLEEQLTERKKMERILRQTQKMEAIGKLAGGIAHDFNNILSPIIGYTELAITDLDSNAPIQTNLAEVMKAGIRAKNLVRQILTFTRQSEGHSGAVDIAQPVKEALALLRSTLPSTIDIVENIVTDLVPVQCDATQIYQIVMNLCTNASHAMEENGGILEVALDRVVWDSKYIVNYRVLPKGVYIKLSISDTGVGIEPQVMESIFDPYFTTKEKGKGTGLGLAVVHGIVKNHGGEINVYSEPNHGTTFTIYFPAIEAEILTPEKVEINLPTGTESILFVDDEVSIVNMCKQMLEQFGYRVTTVTRSTEALRLFEDHPRKFDAVVTDMTMPDMRGDQLAKRMIRLRADIPIIICSGFSSHISRRQFGDIDVRNVLMKPFTQRDLVTAVRQALDADATP